MKAMVAVSAAFVAVLAFTAAAGMAAGTADLVASVVLLAGLGLAAALVMLLASLADSGPTAPPVDTLPRRVPRQSVNDASSYAGVYHGAATRIAVYGAGGGWPATVVVNSAAGGTPPQPTVRALAGVARAPAGRKQRRYPSVFAARAIRHGPRR